MGILGFRGFLGIMKYMLLAAIISSSSCSGLCGILDGIERCLCTEGSAMKKQYGTDAKCKNGEEIK